MCFTPETARQQRQTADVRTLTLQCAVQVASLTTTVVLPLAEEPISPLMAYAAVTSSVVVPRLTFPFVQTTALLTRTTALPFARTRRWRPRVPVLEAVLGRQFHKPTALWPVQWLFAAAMASLTRTFAMQFLPRFRLLDSKTAQ